MLAYFETVMDHFIGDFGRSRSSAESDARPYRLWLRYEIHI